VFASDGQLIEIQACGEKRSFAQAEFDILMTLARQGAESLFELQRKALGLLT
jgi:ribonuclease PH